MARKPNSLAANTREMMESVVLPGACALLGSRLGGRLLDSLAGMESLFRAHVDAMARGRRRISNADGDAAFRFQARRYCLAEHRDFYRSRWFGPRLAARHLRDRDAPWPERGGFLALGFHRAGGFHVLDDLAAHGFRPLFLHRPPAPGSVVSRLTAHWRVNHLRRMGGGELLATGGSYQRIRDALGNSAVVVALADVPADAGQSSCEVTVAGCRLKLRSGLFRLAVEARVPVVFFHTALDSASSYRLHVSQARIFDTAEMLARQAGAELETSLRADDAAWHYLNGVEHLLSENAR